MKYLLITLFCLCWIGLSTTRLQAQTTSKEVKTVVVHTSATCDECELIIESALLKVKGVKTASLDLDTKDVTVTYANWKTDEAAIRKAISQAGYDADELKADQEAYDNLPKCCKKGAHE